MCSDNHRKITMTCTCIWCCLILCAGIPCYRIYTCEKEDIIQYTITGYLSLVAHRVCFTRLSTLGRAHGLYGTNVFQRQTLHENLYSIFAIKVSNFLGKLNFDQPHNAVYICYMCHALHYYDQCFVI